MGVARPMLLLVAVIDELMRGSLGSLETKAAVRRASASYVASFQR